MKKIKVGKGWVVVHSSPAYEPTITFITRKDVNDYFSEDNGFEKNTATEILMMAGHKPLSLDGGNITITVNK